MTTKVFALGKNGDIFLSILFIWIGFTLVFFSDKWFVHDPLLFPSSQGYAQLIPKKGEVRYKLSQNVFWRDLLLNQSARLEIGDSIFTGPEGEAHLLLSDGKVIHVLPNSILVVHESEQGKEFLPSLTLMLFSKPDLGLQLKQGQLNVQFAEQSTPLRIQTAERKFKLYPTQKSSMVEIKKTPVEPVSISSTESNVLELLETFDGKLRSKDLVLLSPGSKTLLFADHQSETGLPVENVPDKMPESLTANRPGTNENAYQELALISKEKLDLSDKVFSLETLETTGKISILPSHVTTRLRKGQSNLELLVPLKWRPLENVSQYEVFLIGNQDEEILSKVVLQAQTQIVLKEKDIKDYFEFGVVVQAKDTAGKLVKSNKEKIQVQWSAPIPIHPQPGAKVYFDKFIYFTWSRTLFAQNYHIQIANDSKFHNLIVDRPLKKNYMVMSKQMSNIESARGKVFWRVRTEYFHHESPWSHTNYFELK